MALVALFIACSAADIVLADDVALVVAVVILVAAEVTLVAADETVLAAAAAVGVLPAVAGLLPLAAVTFVLVVGLGRVTGKPLESLALVDPLRAALAGLRRAAVRARV